MARQIGGRGRSRLWGGRPDNGLFFSPQIQRFAWLIGDRVVSPRTQPVFAAIFGPRNAQPRLGCQETEVRVCDHVDPGSRSNLSGRQVDAILASIWAETAQAVVM